LAKKKPVKKVSKSTNYLKQVVSEFFEKSMEIIISSIAKANVFEWMKDMTQVKERIRRSIALVVLSIAGVVLLGTGIASYLAQLVPKLTLGLSQIIVGAALILLGLIYIKMR